ncbi:MAG: hypothetical protein H6811_08160 [Phycisphaeraceae bacterium]|nr:hypothetical protein [Phycisphaeraceae bacterium]
MHHALVSSLVRLAAIRPFERERVEPELLSWLDFPKSEGARPRESGVTVAAPARGTATFVADLGVRAGPLEFVCAFRGP